MINGKMQLAITFGFLYLIVASITLYYGKVIGISDNGDFIRIIEPLGLLQRNGAYFNWFSRYYYQYNEPLLLLPSITPTALFGYIAIKISNISNNSKLFDIVYLSMMYTLLTGITVAILTHKLIDITNDKIAGSLLSLCIIYIITTPSYLVFYNSFYQDATSMLLFTTTIAFILGIKNNKLPHCLTTAIFFAIILSLTKTQYMLSAIILLFSLMIVSKKIFLGKINILLLSIFLCMAPLFIHTMRVTDTNSYFNRLDPVNRFNAVYNGIAVIAQEKNKILASLDLPLDTVPFIRSREGSQVKCQWITDAEEAYFFKGKGNAYEKLSGYSRIKLALIYASDFKMISQLFQSTLYSMGLTTIEYLGNYQIGEGDSNSRFTYNVAWENIRKNFRHVSIIYIAIPLLAILVTIKDKNKSALAISLIFSYLFILSQYVIVILGDGFFEHSKHLTLAKYAFDTSLPLLIIYIYRVFLDKQVNEYSAGTT